MTQSKSKLKVLLVNPRATYAYEIAQKCYPPLNLLYLATALKRAGHDVRVLDANALRMGDEDILQEARNYDPDLIGSPLYTEIMAPVYRMLSAFHDALPNARIVMGGPHASALPGETLENYPFVDYILRGESEESIASLTNALANDLPMAEIDGLSYRSGDEIVHNPPAPGARDLDALGVPARELVDDVYQLKRYYTLLVRHRPVDTIITSRGCPFNCNFCYNQNHHYRYRSTEHVMDEIVSIYQRGIRDIEIVDDTFTVKRDRATALFDELIRENMRLSFRIKSRVDVVDEEFVRKAKKAGVYLISYGMESGDDEMLKRMNKRTTVADNENAIRVTRKAGVACHSGWIIGYPGETPESIDRTVKFIIKNKPTTAQLAILRPYPHTTAYREAKESGALMGDWSVHSDEYPWVKLPWTESRADLEKALQRAVRKVYFRPYYVYQFGAMMLAGANVTLAAYAFQEMRKTLAHMLGFRRAGRPGSV